MIENDARASNQCKNEITIFSPTDGAIKEFKKPIDHQIIMNGMGKYFKGMLISEMFYSMIFAKISTNDTFFLIIVNTAFDITNILNLGRRGSSTVTARLASMSQGSPPLWLTRKNNDFYLNGAKLTFRNLGVGLLSNIA